MNFIFQVLSWEIKKLHTIKRESNSENGTDLSAVKPLYSGVFSEGREGYYLPAIIWQCLETLLVSQLR